MTHTATHTQGPSCTCQVKHHRHDTGIGIMEETDIDMCPFHTAAPAMYEALKALVDVFPSVVKMTPYGVSMDISKLHDNAKAALSQAEGR